MPQMLQIQSNFNAGAIDPLLANRIDIEQFYEGVQTARNVVSPPQGGLKRRGGLQFIKTLAGRTRLVPFSFNVQQDYVFAFTEGQIEVFREDESVAIIPTPYTADQLPELDYAQSADVMIVVHPSHAPRKIVRQGSDVDWSIEIISYYLVPQYDFDDSNSPAAVPDIQDLNFNGTWNGSNTYRLELEGLVSEIVTYSSSAASNIERIIRALEGLTTIPAGSVTVTHRGGTGYQIRLDGAGADNWAPIAGTTVVGSGTIAVSKVQNGRARKEDVWSDTRGWPATVTFHEGRLWFGGTLSRPQTLFGSAVGDFFNFDPGDGLDDQAIVVTLDTDQVNAITALHSARHFQIFTTGGEFYCPTNEGNPITPTRIIVRRQTQHGTKKIRPVLMDGATLFLDRRGKILRQFVYAFEEEGYTAPSASLLSSHLLNAPVAMAALRGTDSDQANFVFIVNGDGTVAVFNVLRSQSVASWTNWDTQGKFTSVCVIDTDVYFSVERVLNGQTVTLLEKLNQDIYTDSAVIQDFAQPTTTVPNLDHLNNMTCRVKTDDIVQKEYTPQAGQIELVTGVFDKPRPATRVEVGLNFDPLIECFAPAQQTQEGSTFNRRKRIVRASVNCSDTLGVYLMGQPLPDREFSDETLDEAPKPYTGQKEIFNLGWSDFPFVTITQIDPLPMYVRSLVQEVHVS